MNNKKRIGLLIAAAAEIDSALKRYGATTKKSIESGYTVLIGETDNYTIYVIYGGTGEIAAASGTQYLISKYNIDMMINCGIVGGLTDEMKKAKTCIVERVVHYDYDISEVDNCEVGRYLDYPSVYLPTTKELVEKALQMYPEFKKVTCASGDKFIGDVNKKKELHEKFDADICEMEAAGIVLTCNKNKVPCLLIKTVADSITGGADEFHKEMERSSDICLEIAEKIIEIL